jgi:hypothetical protein
VISQHWLVNIGIDIGIGIGIERDKRKTLKPMFAGPSPYVVVLTVNQQPFALSLSKGKRVNQGR